MAGKKNTKGVELGLGYVSLTVDSSGVAEEIEEELGTAGKKAGAAAGKNASSEINKKLKDGVKAGAVAAGAAAGAGIVSGLKQASDMRDLAPRLQAQLGIPPEEARKIAEAAGGAYTSGWGESLEEIGKSAGYLAQQLEMTGDSGNLEELTTRSQAIADTFEQDTLSLANSAGQLVKTGLVDNMDAAFDLMAAGFQSNSKLSEDFLDSIDEYGVQFETLGLNGAESLGLMNQALLNGARNGDQAVDALKEFAIRGKDGSKAAAEGYELLGFSAEEMTAKLARGGDGAKQVLQDVLDGLRAMEDPVEQNTAGVGLFGTKWEDMQQSLEAMDPSTATAKLGELGGAAADLEQNAKGFDQVVAELGRTLNESLGAAVTPLLPHLTTLAEKGLVFFQWFGDHPTITGILLGIGVALGLVAGAVFVLNAAVMVSPITWVLLIVIAVVALVIAAIVVFIRHWDDLEKAAGMAGAAIGELWGELCGKISAHWDETVTYFSDGWNDAVHLFEVGAMNMLVMGTHVWNGLIHGANGVIHAVNGIARAIEYVLTLGGKLGDFGGGWGDIGTFDLVDIPGLATGGTVTGSGTVMVGERGPELLKLPGGASVIPLDHPASGVSGNGGSSKTVNLTINNPTAEKTSVTTRKASQLIGASLGV